MASFLVSGGAGFIGSNLVEALRTRGNRVRVLDDFSTGFRQNLAEFEPDVEIVEGSITSAEDCTRAVRGMDFVLHHAALPSVARSVADPATSHEVNATGTLNLLTASRDAGIKRVVYASSSSIYGDQPVDYKHEELPMSPRSPYAAAKASGEHYLRGFSTCYGLETVALRYFNVFGPRQDPNSAYSAVIPLFVRAMLAGESPQIHGDGTQARDFTFVENNVHANILAATGDFEARGQAYNIACGESFTLFDLVAAVNDALGTNIAPVHTDARAGDIRVSKADISRAKNDLRYEVRVPFEEGLRRTINWYREQWGR
jgi:nucleoside-diphosphate-sugar epimerase